MSFRWEYEDMGGHDWYSYTCDVCGWSILVPDGADVAGCPRCEGRGCGTDRGAGRSRLGEFPGLRREPARFGGMNDANA